MKLFKTVSLALGLVAVSACGTQDSVNMSRMAAVADGFDVAKLPSAAIVRVPVDAKGNQIADKAELRVVDANASVDVKNADQAANAFAGATTPKNVRENVIVDELDRDTATESCWRWRRYAYACAVGCGVTYAPTVYYGPVAYTYSRPVYYYQAVATPVYATTVVGYTYYYYPRYAGTVTYVY